MEFLHGRLETKKKGRCCYALCSIALQIYNESIQVHPVKALKAKSNQSFTKQLH